MHIARAIWPPSKKVLASRSHDRDSSVASSNASSHCGRIRRTPLASPPPLYLALDPPPLPPVPGGVTLVPPGVTWPPLLPIEPGPAGVPAPVPEFAPVELFGLTVPAPALPEVCEPPELVLLFRSHATKRAAATKKMRNLIPRVLRGVHSAETSGESLHGM